MSERRGAMTATRFRSGLESDLDAISAVEAASYTGAATGLSRQLLNAPVETLSYVAERDDGIVGHVLLTPVQGPDRALALAPLAILPQWRDMQIGTELVRHALTSARQLEWRSVFVFGQPDYYRRFGFKSGLADTAIIPWQGPRFLALELIPGALKGWSGPLDYPPAFEAVAKSTHR